MLCGISTIHICFAGYNTLRGEHWLGFDIDSLIPHLILSLHIISLPWYFHPRKIAHPLFLPYLSPSIDIAAIRNAHHSLRQYYFGAHITDTLFPRLRGLCGRSIPTFWVTVKINYRFPEANYFHFYTRVLLLDSTTCTYVWLIYIATAQHSKLSLQTRRHLLILLYCLDLLGALVTCHHALLGNREFLTLSLLRAKLFVVCMMADFSILHKIMWNCVANTKG